jgi:hypothetical protein
MASILARERAARQKAEAAQRKYDEHVAANQESPRMRALRLESEYAAKRAADELKYNEDLLKKQQASLAKIKLCYFSLNQFVLLYRQLQVQWTLSRNKKQVFYQYLKHLFKSI